MTQPSTLMDLLRCPVVVAPMAGGPSTADLVVAAARAGALGFLAAGYKTPGAMAGEIAAVRAATSQPFGVNVLVPGTPYPDAAALASYLGSVGPAADLGEATWDDDSFDGKVAAWTHSVSRVSRPAPIGGRSPTTTRPGETTACCR